MGQKRDWEPGTAYCLQETYCLLALFTDVNTTTHIYIVVIFDIQYRIFKERKKQYSLIWILVT